MKSKVDDTFTETLHVGRPNIGDKADILRRVEGVLDRLWLTNHGPSAQELEERLADLLGVKHCIAMCNGTVALEIAIRAMDLRGEVILPSFTFVATAHALQWQEIRPVFCDIDPKTFCIDPQEVRRHITHETSGIIGVHLWGRPCDTDALQKVADEHDIPILYDAAHAFGCRHQGRYIGNFGRAEVFSFHATKFFNTLEGGAVATNDDELAQKIRLMKNFGFSGQDNVIYIGINGKMNEVCAAVGLSNFDHIDEFIEINRVHYEAYRKELKDIPGIELIHYPNHEKSNYQYITVLVEEKHYGLSRDRLQEALWAHNVRARRYFYPGCHRMEPYRSLYPDSAKWLPVTEALSQKVLLLPTGTAVSQQIIVQIGRLIRSLPAGEPSR